MAKVFKEGFKLCSNFSFVKEKKFFLNFNENHDSRFYFAFIFFKIVQVFLFLFSFLFFDFHFSFVDVKRILIALSALKVMNSFLPQVICFASFFVFFFFGTVEKGRKHVKRKRGYKMEGRVKGDESRLKDLISIVYRKVSNP